MDTRRQAVAVRFGPRAWAAVTAYGNHGGTGRSGYWCEDREGGWGTSTYSPRKAVQMCARPVMYRSRRAAWEAIDPAGEMHRFEAREEA